MKHGETVSSDRKAMYEEGMRRTGGKMNASLSFFDSKGTRMLWSYVKKKVQTKCDQISLLLEKFNLPFLPYHSPCF